jgi:RNA polymerase sigma factor (sigma-70 family)
MATNAKADGTLNRVYLDCRPALQRYLAFSTRCPETAADLVQEVYLRLPNLTPIPSSEAAIKAWLFRVAANLAVDHFRKEKRHQELLSERLSNVDKTEAVPTPETITDHGNQLQEIQDALEVLPTVCKEVLYLSRIEGLTHQAIAERLGISKSWVEKQLVRAVNHLRQTIRDE